MKCKLDSQIGSSLGFRLKNRFIVIFGCLIFLGCSPNEKTTGNEPGAQTTPTAGTKTGQLESESFIEIEGLVEKFYLRSSYFNQNTKVQYQILNSHLEVKFQKAFDISNENIIKETASIVLPQISSNELKNLSAPLDTQFLVYKKKLKDRFEVETKACLKSQVMNYYRTFSPSQRGPAWLILKEWRATEPRIYLALQIDFETSEPIAIGIIKGNWDLSVDRSYVTALKSDVIFGEPSSLNQVSDEILLACESATAEINRSAGSRVDASKIDALASEKLDHLFAGSKWNEKWQPGVSHLLLSEGPIQGPRSLKENKLIINE